METKINTTDLKPGDPVYLGRNGLFNKCIVKNVTPKGMVDVLRDDRVERYRPDGTQQGGDRWSDELDLTQFSERTEYLERRQRAKDAAVAINAIFAYEDARRIRHEWGKDGLTAVVNRLQALLDEAKSKVEAI
jgi:hypothetical protein